MKMNSKAIQKTIDECRKSLGIGALSVSIMLPNKDTPLDFNSGNIRLDSDNPVLPHHIFQIGSITKSFIACLILQLIDERKLSIDDSIVKYVPDIPKAWQHITVKQLLNQSSGIYNYTETFDKLVTSRAKTVEDLIKNYTSKELIDIAACEALSFEPGTNWQYSGTNYVLAGMIIENITNSSIATQIISRFTEPLGLHNTYYYSQKPTADIVEQMVRGYSKRNYFPDEPKDITELDLSWANAGGAMISNAHDTVIWCKKLMSGALLSKEQQKELMTTVPVDRKKSFTQVDGHYGLGLFYDTSSFGEEAWWHSGGTLGYTSIMIWLKKYDIYLTVMANQISGQREVYTIAEMLVKELIKPLKLR